MELFFLTGGLGASIAFFLGLAFANSALRVLLLGSFGALLFSAYHASLAADRVDPLLGQLLHAAGDANALGWIAGTLLVARLRCLEWLELNAEEPAQSQA
jgi:hypothetical protein